MRMEEIKQAIDVAAEKLAKAEAKGNVRRAEAFRREIASFEILLAAMQQKGEGYPHGIDGRSHQLYASEQRRKDR